MARGDLTGLEDSSARGRLASCRVATKPLPGRWRGDALHSSGLHRTEALQRHLLDHLQATSKRKSGMLMGVHSVGCSE